jgi:hypothetical protein
VCALTSGRGGTWLEDDTIIFSPSGGANGPLMRALKAPNGVGSRRSPVRFGELIFVE